MPKSIITLILAVGTVLSLPLQAHAYDPASVPNNYFGIHITHDEDIADAAQLVNSNGGDWGYVTLVIRQDDRDIAKWQRTFDLLRQHHLIPIVRLATSMEQDSWVRPYPHQSSEWASFLDRLNWVVKNRYVILFNEPNHAKEWGGGIDPTSYAAVAHAFITDLKSASPDFFILPAALDLAAPNGPDTMSAVKFYSLMHQAGTDIFTRFDGWSSHSYPNPGFSAGRYGHGLSSIRGYISEIKLLQPYGLDPNIPIFITETGWIHDQGTAVETGLPPQTVAANLSYAFTQVWDHPQIIAVTPFILNYPHPPFDHFSWKKIDEDSYHPVYDTIKALPKLSGDPVRVHSAQIIRTFLPQEFTTQKSYQGRIIIKNTGQSIWETGTLAPHIFENQQQLPIHIDTNLFTVLPHQITSIPIRITTGQDISQHRLIWQLTYHHHTLHPTQELDIDIKPPNLVTGFKLWLYQTIHQDNFSYHDLK